ncbi:hypothetical protein [Jannaschia sp. W003]|uniref:hypothetical protein n=1 Tax=Jannaschia sp. W003 TaxID=2867012 RepID=UPI0021A58A0C|nr:hypothetical protein [Jannaschia sp. W003]UWQ22297.1 hypothetical protein K3554_04490 [Jannaschia sp. W003]
MNERWVENFVSGASIRIGTILGFRGWGGESRNTPLDPIQALKLLLDTEESGISDPHENINVAHQGYHRDAYGGVQRNNSIINIGENLPMFCTSTRDDEETRAQIVADSERYSKEFSGEIYNMVVPILDPIRFLADLHWALRIRKHFAPIGISAKRVQYRSVEDDYSGLSVSNIQQLAVPDLFVKRSRFSAQSEFRMVFHISLEEDEIRGFNLSVKWRGKKVLGEPTYL